MSAALPVLCRPPSDLPAAGGRHARSTARLTVERIARSRLFVTIEADIEGWLDPLWI